jgi:hypothetical protein
LTPSHSAATDNPATYDQAIASLDLALATFDEPRDVGAPSSVPFASAATLPAERVVASGTWRAAADWAVEKRHVLGAALGALVVKSLLTGAFDVAPLDLPRSRFVPRPLRRIVARVRRAS